MSGRLIVVPTPIGHLGDITLRALEVLRACDLVACEDTRRTRVLLDRYSVSVPLVSFHEHNERSRAASLAARVSCGEVVALCSDAGMPGVSDPGFVLVSACLAAGLAVEVLPGASAVVCAVVLSGLPIETWRFAGFVPRRVDAAFWSGAETTVCFESPRRLVATLGSIPGDRPVAVCRELTKLHEEVVRGTAASVASHFAGVAPRGEIVLVVGGAPLESSSAASLSAGVDAVARLVASGARARDAAGVVSDLTGLAANALYRGHLDRR